MSAVMPQNSAPANMPTYAAMVRPFGYPGLNSSAAWPAIMDWMSRMSESTAYPNPLRTKTRVR